MGSYMILIGVLQDSTGRVVKEFSREEMEAARLRVSNLKTGNYFLTIFDKNNKILFNIQIPVIQK